MRSLSRSWDILSPRERIVAMSLVVGGSVAIVNSTVWALAASFMSYQKARVAIAEAQAYAHARPAIPGFDAQAEINDEFAER